MLKAKRRAILLLVLSFLLALVAGFMYMQKMGEIDKELGERIEVVVAAKDIASRKMLTPEDIKKIEIPTKYLTDSHITKVEDLENKVSVVPLGEGDLLTKNMLKQAMNTQKDNTRIVAIYATEKVGFDQSLEAMDRIDIISSNQDKETKEIKTSVFMKDVPVAMVSKNDEKFLGIAVEVPVEEATKLIHEQNFSHSLRILKANVGK